MKHLLKGIAWLVKEILLGGFFLFAIGAIILSIGGHEKGLSLKETWSLYWQACVNGEPGEGERVADQFEEAFEEWQRKRKKKKEES